MPMSIHAATPTLAARLLRRIATGDLTLDFAVHYLVLFLITAAWVFSLTHRSDIHFGSRSNGTSSTHLDVFLVHGNAGFAIASEASVVATSSLNISVEPRPFDCTWWSSWEVISTMQVKRLTVPLWIILVPALAVLWIAVLRRTMSRRADQDVEADACGQR